MYLSLLKIHERRLNPDAILCWDALLVRSGTTSRFELNQSLAVLAGTSNAALAYNATDNCPMMAIGTFNDKP